MSPINANSGEYKSVIGLDSLYIAEVISDTAAEYVAGTPEPLAPAASASKAPSVSTDTQYMDNQPYDVLHGRGATVVSLEVSGLPAEMKAKIIGDVFDAASGRVQGNEGMPAQFALGFRSMKTNGSYHYDWFLRGSFDAPTEEAATNKDKPDVKITKLTYTALKTIHKFTLSNGKVESLKYMAGDEDTDNFTATGWFSQVQTPATVTPSALALSLADPLDNASNVVVTKTITLTFNNALANNAIYGITVAKADGTPVACTNSLDTSKKILTVDPNASLSASTTYIVGIGVTDVFGQSLNTAINFATAS